MKETKEIRNTEFEVRAESDSRRVVGRAIVFNSITDLGWYMEKIAPEAVDDLVLAQDVRALFNHDANLILARTKSGTLKLEKTAEGLDYSFDSPDTTYGNDLLVSLSRGDVSGSSFGFTVKKDSWERMDDGRELRTILKIGRLLDISPVTFPAYADTEAAKRSHDEAVLETNTIDTTTTDTTTDAVVRYVPTSVYERELQLIAERLK